MPWIHCSWAWFFIFAVLFLFVFYNDSVVDVDVTNTISLETHCVNSPVNFCTFNKMKGNKGKEWLSFH